MRIQIFILCFALLLTTLCSAKGVPDFSTTFSTRVSLSIQADEPLKGKIESFLGRELRSLGDVIVTDYESDRVLSLVAHELTTGGSANGVVVPVVV